MVLAQKQTHRSVEKNREPRNKPTHLWSINLLQRRQEYTMKKWQFLSSMSDAGKKMDSYTWKNEIRMFPHTMYKNKHKMD